MAVLGTRLVTRCGVRWAWFDLVGWTAVPVRWRRTMEVTLLVLVNL